MLKDMAFCHLQENLKINMVKKLIDTDTKTGIYTEIEAKIPNISDLATNSALTAVENRIPDISSFVQKKKIMMLKYQTLKKSY